MSFYDYEDMADDLASQFEAESMSGNRMQTGAKDSPQKKIIDPLEAERKRIQREKRKKKKAKRAANTKKKPKNEASTPQLEPEQGETINTFGSEYERVNEDHYESAMEHLDGITEIPGIEPIAYSFTPDNTPAVSYGIPDTTMPHTSNYGIPDSADVTNPLTLSYGIPGTAKPHTLNYGIPGSDQATGTNYGIPSDDDDDNASASGAKPFEDAAAPSHSWANETVANSDDDELSGVGDIFSVQIADSSVEERQEPPKPSTPTGLTARQLKRREKWDARQAKRDAFKKEQKLKRQKAS
eukprot:TRINITY_DN7921_c0_g1_i1.p1 TRINITY_DN7921_c0_g1~~TRINITY_DN7921_c0_g1_i1.p1  ORF type:complete len:297 (-),score=78.30 TRINITY_DN7921_c0_g1_i1:319-1209(-)